MSGCLAGGLAVRISPLSGGLFFFAPPPLNEAESFVQFDKRFLGKELLYTSYPCPLLVTGSHVVQGRVHPMRHQRCDGGKEF